MRRAGIISVSLFFFIFLFVSCEKPQKNNVKNEVLFNYEEVSYNSTGQFISILSSQKWKIVVKCKDGSGYGWCRAEPSSGKGSKNDIMLIYDQNETDAPRKAEIQFLFSDNDVIVKYLTQNPKSDSGGENPDYGDSLVSDVVNNWMELPEVNVADGFAYVYHTAELTNNTGSRIVRNYSIYYDAGNKIALWVAYPLCKDYLGTQKRTDAWGYDPKIPAQYQPQLKRGWHSWGYDRGHQLPSASRTSSRALNAQTFYYTNMTAQTGKKLNQGVWAKTEEIVRGYISTCDTLYVATGPVLTTESNPAITYIDDNAGQKVAVPKAYFKVLLKLKYEKKGNKTDTLYHSIGFWFENKDYDESEPSVSDLQTVSKIEELTGIKFFDNLPDNIEDAIKNQFEPSKWGF